MNQAKHRELVEATERYYAKYANSTGFKSEIPAVGSTPHKFTSDGSAFEEDIVSQLGELGVVPTHYLNVTTDNDDMYEFWPLWVTDGSQWFLFAPTLSSDIPPYGAVIVTVRNN